MEENPPAVSQKKIGTLRKVLGIILIVLGFAALVTPLTPGALLLPIGLEIFGFRLLFYKKIKERVKAFFDKNRKVL